MKKSFSWFWMMILMVWAAACSVQPAAPTPAVTATTAAPLESTPLTGLKFHFVDGIVGGKDIQDQNTGINLEFTGQGQVVGKAPCNSYFGQYQAGEDGSIKIDQLGMTLKACPASDLESAYLSGLGEAARFELDEKNGLKLFNTDGSLVLNFEPAAPASGGEEQTMLRGNYSVVGLTVNGAAVNLPAEAVMTLNFEAAGRFSGKSVCNNYFGRVEFGPENAVTMSAVGATKMMCPQAMEVETVFFQALTQIDHSEMDAEGKLNLLSADGQARIVLQAGQ